MEWNILGDDRLGREMLHRGGAIPLLRVWLPYTVSEHGAIIIIIIRIQSHNTKEKQMYCAAQDQEYHSQLRALGP